jgi:CBS domain-containing protein
MCGRLTSVNPDDVQSLKHQDEARHDGDRSNEDLVTIHHDASAAQIEQDSRDFGRSRLIVINHSGHIVGMVHIRDAARATTAGLQAAAADLMTEPPTPPHRPPVAPAVCDNGGDGGPSPRAGLARSPTSHRDQPPWQ